jgi:hypothetical protein
MNCRECAHAMNDGLLDSASIPVYYCRRFPPTLPPLADGKANQFPRVRSYECCGEFKMNPNDKEASQWNNI